jgi:CheY-like chemotaxis protein
MRSRSKRTIVIIENSDEDYEVTVWALRAAGVRNPLLRCTTAEAIDKLLKVQATGPNVSLGSSPLLVLLDINIPGTDRHDTLQRLRNHPWWKFVPVVIISTSRNPGDLSACYGLGAAGYLVKPLDLDAFAASIRRLADYWFGAVILPELNDGSTARREKHLESFCIEPVSNSINLDLAQSL